MTPSRLRSAFVLAAICLSATGLVLAGQQTVVDHSRKLPTDPDVTAGTFANGLRYYIRANALPEKRAELRLAVNVGSLMEDDDQQGLAHFVEHMAFNGTKNFPKTEIVAFMESIGMRFGPSVNAFTSFDETVYMLQVPTDRPEVLERALLVLEDWARHVTFDAEEIDKERGVIMEEWRLRRGAAARMQDRQLPILLKGSRYADRLPIGKLEIIQNFAHARLRQFYADWYRPDLMAVIAVGDFDRAAMQQAIEKRFAGIPRPSKARPRTAYEIPPQPGTLYAIATDPEAGMSSVSLYSKMAFRDPSTVGAYRQQLVERVFSALLSARLSEIAQKPDAPFMGAGTSRGLFVKTGEASTLTAVAKDGQIAQSIETLFVEMERVVRFGFTSTELEREKTAMLRGMAQALAEKDKQQSATYAAEYIRVFTQDEPYPGLANEADLVRALMPGVTLAEVNALAREWMPDGNRVVMVSAPEKPGVPVPDEAALRAAIAAAAARPIEAYTDTTTEAPLVPNPPAPGKVIETRVRQDTGITEWTLSNGVRVVIKPTAFKQDEVVFRAFSPGGTSLVGDDDLIWAETAAPIIAAGGLGDASQIELRKRLAGIIANVSPYIGALDEGLSGSGSVKDVETLFQLIYLAFTAPRADPNIFQVFKTQSAMILGNMRTQPAFAFSEALSDALTQGHPRAKAPTPDRLATMSLEQSFAFYKDRFGDAGDFTFVFVGTVDPDALKPLAEQYLASLPASGRKESWRDHKILPPSGVVERVVEKGLEPQSQTQIVFTGPFPYNQEQRIAIRTVASILQTRLREILREDLGGTYSVSVNAGYDKFPREQYQLAVGFGSSPDRAAELARRVLAEVEAFRRDGPTARQLADAIEGFQRDHETNIRTNGYLLAQIAVKYQFGEADEVGVLFDLPAWYAKVSAASIHEAARRYLDPTRYVKVTLLPEKGK